MTTPAERLRRALPPKPKGGYEPGTVAADTAAVLDQLDVVLKALAHLDDKVAALRAENATIQRAWDTAFDRGVEAGANDAERDAALAALEQLHARISDREALAKAIGAWEWNETDGDLRPWQYVIADLFVAYLTGAPEASA